MKSVLQGKCKLPPIAEHETHATHGCCTHATKAFGTVVEIVDKSAYQFVTILRNLLWSLNQVCGGSASVSRHSADVRGAQGGNAHSRHVHRAQGGGMRTRTNVTISIAVSNFLVWHSCFGLHARWINFTTSDVRATLEGTSCRRVFDGPRGVSPRPGVQRHDSFCSRVSMVKLVSRWTEKTFVSCVCGHDAFFFIRHIVTPP